MRLLQLPGRHRKATAACLRTVSSMKEVCVWLSTTTCVTQLKCHELTLNQHDETHKAMEETYQHFMLQLVLLKQPLRTKTFTEICSP